VVEKESRENPPVNVIPREEDGWAVVREGNKKASAVHPTRHQAEQHGRSLARQNRTDFYLYDKQGRILAHDFYGPPYRPHGGEVAYGEEMGQLTITRTDTGAVQRQVAYYDREKDIWTVEAHTYPALEESNPGIREAPIGRAPTESDIYEELSSDDMQRLYPKLWEKVKPQSPPVPSSKEEGTGGLCFFFRLTYSYRLLKRSLSARLQ
jgi:hypothetical protein